MEQNQEAAAVKKAPPVLSSSAGAKAGDTGVGITLFVNPEASSIENAPDLTGYYTKNGVKNYVAGWLVPGGVSADTQKPYAPFVALRQTERKGNDYVTIGQGTLQGMNSWKGEPVDATHRSRAIANLKVNGVDITATGYATEELVKNEELAAAFGFAGPVLAESLAQEGQEQRKSPKP